MQIKNTKSFSEIMANATEGQRYSIGTALISEGCCKTRQTVWNWANNKCTPASVDTKIHIAKIAGKVLGQRVSHLTLFPE